MKKFLVIFEVVLIVLGIAMAEGTVLPLTIAGMLFYPVHKILCGMTEEELRDTFGITFIEKHFGNNKFAKIFTDIEE